MILTQREQLRKLSQGHRTEPKSQQHRSCSQLKISEERTVESVCNSNYSTCCSNSVDSPPKSLNNLDEVVVQSAPNDPFGDKKYQDFDELLPLRVGTLNIPKITWAYFPAIPSEMSVWKAHCYWTVGYCYDISMKKMKNSNQVRYKLLITSWCCLSNKSWVKKKWDRLLEHETGHYLIGCLCALEFKVRADKQKYTKNYRIECTKIFQETFQKYLQMEKKYDEETHHSQNLDSQKQWNKFIKDELRKY